MIREVTMFTSGIRRRAHSASHALRGRTCVAAGLQRPNEWRARTHIHSHAHIRVAFVELLAMAGMGERKGWRLFPTDVPIPACLWDGLNYVQSNGPHIQCYLQIPMEQGQLI